MLKFRMFAAALGLIVGGYVAASETTIVSGDKYESAETVRLKRELVALQQDHAKMLELLKDIAGTANRAHDRLNGIKLYVADTTMGNEFHCGQEDAIGGNWVMSGSRDGTGCQVKNRNHYKRLEVSVPQ